MPGSRRPLPRLQSSALAELSRGYDRVLWEHAKTNGFVLVTQDSDFADMAALYGAPPKVIWLRCGNRPSQSIEKLLRDHASAIATFEQDPTATCLEIP